MIQVSKYIKSEMWFGCNGEQLLSMYLSYIIKNIG